MKWIGQHIYDLISRFRSDVYLEDIDTGTIASGGNLGLDSNNKIVKATVSSGSGDIESVSITTDTGPGGRAQVGSGAASFIMVGASGVGVTNSGVTITSVAVPGEIDHDSLLNFAADEHFTQANITTVGTIGTGTWQGTAIAQAYIAGDAINGDKIADDAVDSEHYTDGSIDTAHIADAQITVAKLHADAIQTSGESFADNDTSLMTSASINDRINRPDKQIVLMRAGFKDDLGTNKHYVPLQSELEQTLYYHEMNSFVAPFAGKLLKVMYRGSGDFSGGAVSFTLEQIDRNEAFLTTPDVLETITVTGPTNDTTDPNMVTANFVGGSGTNAFVAGDMIMLGMQFDTDVTGSNSRHFFTLVFEFDFSGLA